MLQAASEYLRRIGLSIHLGQPLNIHERELRRASLAGGALETAAYAHRGAVGARREPPGGRFPGQHTMPGHGAGPERRWMPGAGDIGAGGGSMRPEADRRPPIDHGSPPPGRSARPGGARGYEQGGYEPPAWAAARDTGDRYRHDSRDGGHPRGDWRDSRERLDGPPLGASTVPPPRDDGRGILPSHSFDEPWNRDRRRRKRVQSGSSSSSGDERPPPNSRPRCEAPGKAP